MQIIIVLTFNGYDTYYCRRNEFAVIEKFSKEDKKRYSITSIRFTNE